VASVRGHLQSGLGVAKGDVVTVMSPNHCDLFSAMHGVLSLGATVTPVNPLYMCGEVASQLKGSQSQVVIAHPVRFCRAGAERDSRARRAPPPPPLPSSRV
jgi:acyl-CoA synthetase (AMP-forming)/AMP-acid ligase II